MPPSSSTTRAPARRHSLKCRPLRRGRADAQPTPSAGMGLRRQGRGGGDRASARLSRCTRAVWRTAHQVCTASMQTQSRPGGHRHTGQARDQVLAAITSRIGLAAPRFRRQAWRRWSRRRPSAGSWPRYFFATSAASVLRRYRADRGAAGFQAQRRGVDGHTFGRDSAMTRAMRMDAGRAELAGDRPGLPARHPAQPGAAAMLVGEVRRPIQRRPRGHAHHARSRPELSANRWMARRPQRTALPERCAIACDAARAPLANAVHASVETEPP